MVYIERRDLRVLPDGWYWLEIEKVEEVLSGYGPALKLSCVVFSGSGFGSRVAIQTDRVATSGNKLGRLLRAVEGAFSGGEFLDSGWLVGRRFCGRVCRYDSGGRVKAKVVEFKSLLEGEPTDGV